MKQKDQKKLLEAWNELEEVSCDFRDLDEKDIIGCKNIIKSRVDKAMGIIGDFISEKVFQELVQ